MKKKTPLLGAGWLVFLVGTAILLAIIAIGVMNARDTGLPWEQLAEERVISTTSIPEVEVSARLTDLRDAPQLELQATGLDPDRVLEVWLADPEDEHLPHAVTRIEVESTGEVEAEIPIQEGLWHRYSQVVGVQGERTVFRAAL